MLVLTFAVGNGPMCMLLISGKLLRVNILVSATCNYTDMESSRLQIWSQWAQEPFSRNNLVHQNMAFLL
jgi:hypothetical protein